MIDNRPDADGSCLCAPLRRDLGLAPTLLRLAYMAFQFEKLQVYQLALDWVEYTETLCRESKGTLSVPFKDQLRRASLSIPLNIAEGNGRWHSAEKRQFFWIARGSVFECVPLLDLLKRGKHIAESDFVQARDRLDHLGRMLTNLVKAHDETRRFES